MTSFCLGKRYEWLKAASLIIRENLNINNTQNEGAFTLLNINSKVIYPPGTSSGVSAGQVDEMSAHVAFDDEPDQDDQDQRDRPINPIKNIGTC